MQSIMTSRLAQTILLLAILTVLTTVAIAFLVTTPFHACRPGGGTWAHGLISGKLVSGGQTRCYLLHIPSAETGKGPFPLVISLHGFASNAAGQVYLSGWNQVSDEMGLVVAYPQGTGYPLRWNASADFGESGVDDVQFLRDLIDHLGAKLPIDTSQVYVNGMSNGGAMAGRAGCELADQVAAIGIVAAPPVTPPGGCVPARPIPVIAFFGDADPLVPYNPQSDRSGSEGQRRTVPDFPPVEAWIAAWADRSRCLEPAESIHAPDGIRAVHYAECAENAEIILYTIEGGGHAWPGGQPTFVGRTSQAIDASRAMWAFFDRYQLKDR